MRKTREEKAITLIALIITIVVLLILAVVAINAVTGNGIIQHATNAKKEYQEAQAEEEGMLSYYEGVLQSGEVVPTVKQLQEKYTFSYFSSLSRAIENVNGDTTKTADVNAENAVAGIYEDSGNKYVVLMKDTEESTTININKNMTINLGGKILSLTADAAYLNFAADISCTIDGRLAGSTIQKNILNGTSYGIINTVGRSLIIDSGKYCMNGKYSKARVINAKVTDSINVYNAEISFNNQAEEVEDSRALQIVSASSDNIIESEIINCRINITSIIGRTVGVACRDVKATISDSKISALCDRGLG